MDKEKPILGYDKFLMMAILKDGPLSLEELWEKSILFLSLIWYQQLPEKGHPLTEKLFFKATHLRSKLEEVRTDKSNHSAAIEIDKLVKKGWINLNNVNKYELTKEGLIQAKIYESKIVKKAIMVDKELEPSTTAKNTTILDAFLAFLKLGGGLISGSMGLIADGTDATMDTVEAVLVWLGIKYHQEKLSTLLVILGLFIASITILFDSVTHLLASLEEIHNP